MLIYCISGLDFTAKLFLYFTSGPFEIESISFETEQEYAIKFEQGELFTLPTSIELEEQVLDKMFCLGDMGDALTRVLMNFVLAQTNIERKLDNIWRAFNALYDWKYSTLKLENTRTRMLALLDYLREEKSGHYQSTIKIFEQFYKHEQDFNRNARIFVEGIDFSNRNYAGDLNRFKQRYLDSGYRDPVVRQRISYMFDDYIGKYVDEFDNEAKILYDKIIQAFSKQDEKKTPSDYVRYLTWCIYYFRNKDFHGEFWPTNFLVQNTPHKELVDYANLLEPLIILLITDETFLSE